MIAKGDTLELVDSPFSHSLVSSYYQERQSLKEQERHPARLNQRNTADEAPGDDAEIDSDVEQQTVLQTPIGTGPPQMAEFYFENRWTSGPLKQFSASPEAFQNSFSSILTVEIIKQKKQCLNLDWLLFEVEEF